eukprot:762517_1
MSRLSGFAIMFVFLASNVSFVTPASDLNLVTGPGNQGVDQRDEKLLAGFVRNTEIFIHRDILDIIECFLKPDLSAFLMKFNPDGKSGTLTGQYSKSFQKRVDKIVASEDSVFCDAMIYFSDGDKVLKNQLSTKPRNGVYGPDTCKQFSFDQTDCANSVPLKVWIHLFTLKPGSRNHTIKTNIAQFHDIPVIAQVSPTNDEPSLETELSDDGERNGLDGIDQRDEKLLAGFVRNTEIFIHRDILDIIECFLKPDLSAFLMKFNPDGKSGT